LHLTVCRFSTLLLGTKEEEAVLWARDAASIPTLLRPSVCRCEQRSAAEELLPL
jgi:hypothetical protein